jgi:hypothetical protein
MNPRGNSGKAAAPAVSFPLPGVQTIAVPAVYTLAKEKI